MAFIPPNFNIVLKNKLSNNNCSTFYKENEYFYSCQDLDVMNFKQCCDLSIKNFMGDYQNNICYATTLQINTTTACSKTTKNITKCINIK